MPPCQRTGRSRPSPAPAEPAAPADRGDRPGAAVQALPRITRPAGSAGSADLGAIDRAQDHRIPWVWITRWADLTRWVRDSRGPDRPGGPRDRLTRWVQGFPRIWGIPGNSLDPAGLNQGSGADDDKRSFRAGDPLIEYFSKGYLFSGILKTDPLRQKGHLSPARDLPQKAAPRGQGLS